MAILFAEDKRNVFTLRLTRLEESETRERTEQSRSETGVAILWACGVWH